MIAAVMFALVGSSSNHVDAAQFSGAVSSSVNPVAGPIQGAYLGLYYSPSYGSGSVQSELAAMSSGLDPQLGRTPAIVSVYQNFAGPWIPNSTLDEIASGQEAIPLVSWACGGVPDSAINAGQYDQTIATYAAQLKAYGLPIMLRWFWEMNLTTNPGYATCLGSGPTGGAAGYQMAFQRIWNIFQRVGATNVSFVWAISSAFSITTDPAIYYPGNQYIGWIGVDGYDRPLNYRGTQGFAYQFSRWYQEFSSYGKPMIVTETGAPTSYNIGKQPPPGEQAAWINGIQSSMPTAFPQIKGLVYYDSPTSASNWEFGAAGMAAFKSLASDPYFSARGPAFPGFGPFTPPPTNRAVTSAPPTFGPISAGAHAMASASNPAAVGASHFAVPASPPTFSTPVPSEVRRSPTSPTFTPSMALLPASATGHSAGGVQSVVHPGPAKSVIVWIIAAVAVWLLIVFLRSRPRGQGVVASVADPARGVARRAAEVARKRRV